MWYNVLPAYVIITAGVAIPGYALYGLHYLFCNGHILPTFFIITAGLGLPGWGLYHIHNLVHGNHFRRSLLDRWERSQYQRDMRVSGSPYIVNGLELIEEYKETAADKTKRVSPDGSAYPKKK